MIDIHAHLMPAVDDGAVDDDQAAAALARLRADGFIAVTATPHLDASLAAQPAAWEARLATFDRAWQRLGEIASEAAPGLELYRGVELMLDTPEPDASDGRLRLDGGAALLIEFPRLGVPPSMPAALDGLGARGLRPVIAHPERYDVSLAGGAERWRATGAALAVNGRALLGHYGSAARAAALTLFERGLVDLVATDYHARGETGAPEVRELLERAAGAEVAHLLVNENPRLLLAGEAPLRVPPVRLRGGLLRRLRGLFD
ncbi:MAG: CpsB/CapC family capsule biosynthesis tyrosine phosphatase [Gemmatimonadota bacterium]